MQHLTDEPVEPRPSQATPEALSAAAVVDLGVAGMGCANCANRIRNALLDQPGVIEADLDVPTALGRVWYEPSRTSVEVILETIAALGERTQHRFFAVALKSGADRSGPRT